MGQPNKAQKTADRPRAAAHYAELEVTSRSVLRAWLEANHASAKGVWVVRHVKSAGGTVTWNDVVEEALAFGWIDNLPRKRDDGRSMLLVTPRKPRSAWSAKNKAHVAELERQGLMAEPGRKVVEAAKTSGAWVALDEVSRLVVPEDLAAALDALPPARTSWDAFPPSVRRGILEWIGNAKRQETRAARVSETARLAQRGERANQWRPKT